MKRAAQIITVAAVFLVALVAGAGAASAAQAGGSCRIDGAVLGGLSFTHSGTGASSETPVQFTIVNVGSEVTTVTSLTEEGGGEVFGLESGQYEMSWQNIEKPELGGECGEIVLDNGLWKCTLSIDGANLRLFISPGITTRGNMIVSIDGVDAGQITATATGTNTVLSVPVPRPGSHDVGLDGIFGYSPGLDCGTIVVPDLTAPEFGAAETPAPVEARSPLGAIVSFDSPVAIDDVDGEIVSQCAPSSGSMFRIGRTTVVCTAVDAAENDARIMFEVSVVDTTPPVFDDVADVGPVEAIDGRGAPIVLSRPIADDLVDGRIMSSCTPAISGVFPIGTTEVACEATDLAGNASTVVFSVTVRDSTAPVFYGTGHIGPVEADEVGGASVDFDPPRAADAVDESLGIDCDRESGELFPIGETTVSCTAVDDAGNSASTTFRVRVVDTTPPDLEGSADVGPVEATGSGGAPVDFDVPVATDVADDDIAAECDRDSGTVFPVGETTVTCTATDDSGNSGRVEFRVTVVDTTAPVFGDIEDPEPVAEADDDGSGTIVRFDAPVAQDTVDGDVGSTCIPAPGETFPLGDTIVTCTATDQAGNSSSAAFTISVVVDPDPPAEVDDLQSIIDATVAAGNGVDRRAARDLDRAVRDLERAQAILGRTPPNAPHALRRIANATRDVDRAVRDGLAVEVAETLIGDMVAFARAQAGVEIAAAVESGADADAVEAALGLIDDGDESAQFGDAAAAIRLYARASSRPFRS